MRLMQSSPFRGWGRQMRRTRWCTPTTDRHDMAGSLGSDISRLRLSRNICQSHAEANPTRSLWLMVPSCVTLADWWSQLQLVAVTRSDVCIEVKSMKSMSQIVDVMSARTFDSPSWWMSSQQPCCPRSKMRLCVVSSLVAVGWKYVCVSHDTRGTLWSFFL